MDREGTTFLMIPIPQSKNHQALSLTVFACYRITSF